MKLATSKINEALKSADETKVLIVGNNIFDKVPQLLKEEFPECEAVIVADKTTYKIAGEKLEKLLKHSGVKLVKSFIFTDSNLYAEYWFVEKLVNYLKSNRAIPIAVGSGTINDLTKLASHETNRKYI